MLSLPHRYGPYGTSASLNKCEESAIGRCDRVIRGFDAHIVRTCTPLIRQFRIFDQSARMPASVQRLTAASATFYG